MSLFDAAIVIDNVITNVGSYDESNWEYILAMYAIYMPGVELIRTTELVAAPGYVEPVWIGWVRNGDGLWTDPSVEPIDPEAP